MFTLYTKDGRPVFHAGFEKYTLTLRRGATTLKNLPQVSSLLPPDSPRNRSRLELVQRQTGTACEWRKAA